MNRVQSGMLTIWVEATGKIWLTCRVAMNEACRSGNLRHCRKSSLFLMFDMSLTFCNKIQLERLGASKTPHKQTVHGHLKSNECKLPKVHRKGGGRAHT